MIAASFSVPFFMLQVCNLHFNLLLGPSVTVYTCTAGGMSQTLDYVSKEGRCLNIAAGCVNGFTVVNMHFG